MLSGEEEDDDGTSVGSGSYDDDTDTVAGKLSTGNPSRTTVSSDSQLAANTMADDSAVQICSECGVYVEAGTRFCSTCGTRVLPSTEVTVRQVITFDAFS